MSAAGGIQAESHDGTASMHWGLTATRVGTKDGGGDDVGEKGRRGMKCVEAENDPVCTLSNDGEEG